MTDPFTAELREAIEQEWTALQAAHGGLRDWTLELSSDPASWNPLGRCYFETRLLVLFDPRRTKDFEVPAALDTLRHESAHALSGAPNHDARWRRLARKLGATPSAREQG